MTALVIAIVSYRSQRVSNFHSSFSTAMKYCLIPSNVSSSRLARMRIGLVINLVAISKTSEGNVALNKTICVAGGRHR